MAEEEKKPEVKQEEKKPEQKQEQAAAAPAPAEKKESAAKKKKINRLSLKEVEKKIAETQGKMGSLTSAYAQQLLKRKEQLLAQGERPEND